MPFKSEKQRRYLWANDPELAAAWSEKYGTKPRRERTQSKKSKKRKSKRSSHG